MLSLPRTLIMTAAATAALLVVPAQAGASPAPSPEVLAQGLAGPLQIDIGSEGQIYVAQSFAGILTKVRPNGTTKDLTTYAGEIAGVASRGYDVAFTTTNGGETAPTTAAYLKVRFSNGTVRNIVNLFTFESKHNPDARNTYGFKNLTAACTAELAPLVDVIGPPTYSGLVDSHPYAIANAPDGGWYIAEAAGNTILKVSRDGRVSVVSVLAPVPVVITAEAAAANGLPACTIGTTYRFEPVPTDVEVGPGGMLYVSSLPGGPEDGSLGALGRVLRIDPDKRRDQGGGTWIPRCHERRSDSEGEGLRRRDLRQPDLDGQGRLGETRRRGPDSGRCRVRRRCAVRVHRRVRQRNHRPDPALGRPSPARATRGFAGRSGEPPRRDDDLFSRGRGRPDSGGSRRWSTSHGRALRRCRRRARRRSGSRGPSPARPPTGRRSPAPRSPLA